MTVPGPRAGASGRTGPHRARPAPVAAAVTIAESLVRLGLRTSKVRTYAPPRPKRFRAWPPAADGRG